MNNKETSTAALLVASEKERQALLQNVDTMRKAIKVLAPVAVASSVALVLSVSAIFFYPRYAWSPVSNQAAICEVQTADRMPIAAATIAEFAKSAAVELYSYDYLNYNRTLTAASNRWLSIEGRKSFFKALDESKNLRRVINDRLSLLAYGASAPQLTTESISADGYRVWGVDVPLILEFYTGGKDKPESQSGYIATVYVKETAPSAMSANALLVEQITLKPDSRVWSMR